MSETYTTDGMIVGDSQGFCMGIFSTVSLLNEKIDKIKELEQKLAETELKHHKADAIWQKLEQKLSEYKARFEEKEGVYYINGRKFVPVEMLDEATKQVTFLEERRDEWRKEHKEQIAANHGLMVKYMEAMEVVRFYGDPESWGELELDTDEHWDDYEKLNPKRPTMSTGGKRARKLMKKHENKL